MYVNNIPFLNYERISKKLRFLKSIKASSRIII